LPPVIRNSRPVYKLHPPQYATLFKKQDENTHEEKLGLLLWRLTRRNCNK